MGDILFFLSSCVWAGVCLTCIVFVNAYFKRRSVDAAVQTNTALRADIDSVQADVVKLRSEVSRLLSAHTRPARL